MADITIGATWPIEGRARTPNETPNSPIATARGRAARAPDRMADDPVITPRLPGNGCCAHHPDRGRRPGRRRNGRRHPPPPRAGAGAAAPPTGGAGPPDADRGRGATRGRTGADP